MTNPEIIDVAKCMQKYSKMSKAAKTPVFYYKYTPNKHLSRFEQRNQLVGFNRNPFDRQSNNQSKL